MGCFWNQIPSVHRLMGCLWTQTISVLKLIVFLMSNCLWCQTVSVLRWWGVSDFRLSLTNSLSSPWWGVSVLILPLSYCRCPDLCFWQVPLRIVYYSEASLPGSHMMLTQVSNTHWQNVKKMKMLKFYLSLQKCLSPWQQSPCTSEDNTPLCCCRSYATPFGSVDQVYTVSFHLLPAFFDICWLLR